MVDDTTETFSHIEEEFGEDVAHLVAGVSKLSYINQVFANCIMFPKSDFFSVADCVARLVNV